MIEKEERQLPILRGELALLIVILINSLGVVLMLLTSVEVVFKSVKELKEGGKA